MTSALVQRLLRIVGLRDAGHPLVIRAHQLRRTVLRTDARIRNEYLQRTSKPKLHIGGGWHRLGCWLNTDLELIPGVMCMDGTKKFPFSNNTFEYVYTEHMIEHVSYAQGEFMLRECHRVMREGGIIRVTTPDLRAILGLYRGGSEAQQKYLAWFCQTFIPNESAPTATFAINAFFRLWGHQFIYDESTLTRALQNAGFKSVKRRRLGESDDPELRKLENVDRYPEGMLDLESVALEATK
jgi:predicted SAM-dependent methyltransferase